MGSTKLTSRLVKALRKKAQREGRTLFCWDTDVRGFGIKATDLRPEFLPIMRRVLG